MRIAGAANGITLDEVHDTRLDQFDAPDADLSLNGHKLTNLADPTQATDAVTKAYADAIAAGLIPKASVVAATTTAGTLASDFEDGDTIDGVVLATGDRILIKDQAAPAANGIYVVAASGAPTRATDADIDAEVTPGIFTFVESGTANGGTQFVLVEFAGTVGTDAQTWSQLSGASDLTAGTGLDLTGSTLSVVPGDLDRADLTGTQDADTITDGTANKVYTAAEKTKLASITPGQGIATIAQATDYDSASREDGLVAVFDGDEDKVAHKIVRFGGIYLAPSNASDAEKWAAKASGGAVMDASAPENDILDAIADAQAQVASSTGAPRILVLPGIARLTDSVEFGSAPVVGLTTPNQGIRWFWDGAADATVFTKDFALPGGASFWELANLNMRAGTATPGTWLDFTGDDIDAMFWLHHLHLGGSTEEMIAFSGWVNAFRNDLRYDGGGTYAESWTPAVTQNLSVASLDRFTFDNNPSTTTKGVFLIDNTANASQLGVFAVRNGRVEYNVDLVSPAAFFHLKASNPANSRVVGLLVENTTIDDVSGTASDCLAYMETTATTMSIHLVMVNVRQTGLTSIFGGTLFSGHSVVPVQSSYGLVAVNAGGSGGYSIIGDNLLIAGGSSGGNTALHYAQKRGSETQNRFQITEQGDHAWGSGSATPDVTLRRGAANLLQTDDRFVAVDGVTTKTKAGAPVDGDFASTPADGTMVVDTTNSKLYIRIGGTWKQTAALT